MKMYGWERLSNMCGLGCKVFWNPWVQGDNKPYGPVLKLDDVNEQTDSFEMDIVTNEPQKPVWSDMKVGAPIVRNKSNSTGNLRSSTGYGKLPVERSLPKLDEKKGSKTDLRGSTQSLVAPKNIPNGRVSDLSSSKKNLTASEERLYVSQLVTTV